MNAVPWTVGVDFTAPTCAVCHMSRLVDADGNIIAERSHDFGSRLWLRIFGLIVSHNQPKSGATHSIVNSDGLPLPTTFGGEPARDFLITDDEAARRKNLMTQVCRACHSTSWVNGFFHRFATVVDDVDTIVLATTDLMETGWIEGLADREHPFDEPVEIAWVTQWLFYANSVRYAAAMSGPDYAAFKNGYWNLHKTYRDIEDKVSGEPTR